MYYIPPAYDSAHSDSLTEYPSYNCKASAYKVTKVLNMMTTEISHNFFILILGCQDTLNHLFWGLWQSCWTLWNKNFLTMLCLLGGVLPCAWSSASHDPHSCHGCGWCLISVLHPDPSQVSPWLMSWLFATGVCPAWRQCPPPIMTVDGECWQACHDGTGSQQCGSCFL